MSRTRSGALSHDEEEEGMLRMSFLEHLDELRSRIIRALAGLGIAFLLCLIFALDLWKIISRPARGALLAIGINPPDLVATAATEQFAVIYTKVPLTAAFFVAAPWILYQVWAFLAPGLYKSERRWALPFVLATAGLFLGGGLFAYFVALPASLPFLLSIAMPVGVKPLITISDYFDTFFNVTVGIALIFELPVLIYFLTLLGIVSPRFLLEKSRYAILGIVIVAALVTQTQDAFNLAMFAIPMSALYFMGVLASYLLVRRREGRRFPRGTFLLWGGALLCLAGGGMLVAAKRRHYKFIRHWPFAVR